MSQERRQSLRDLMLLAWDLYRSDPSRGFADCLAGAWRWTKGRAARLAAQPGWAKGSRARTVAFGTMLQSPIRRSLSGQPYAETRARSAGYVTSMVGR
jgi:hypothetical protein